MSLTINTNLNSIRAQRHLTLSQNGLATSMQRLSSGLRVNSAKDDAAGLAISERMHAQIRGMNQAARNANDAISMLQTAEGATSKVTDMLQRMRELAVQSINDTNSDTDRKALQAEVSQLKAEIERVSATTTFNGAYVFGKNRASAVGTADANLQATLDGLQDRWLGQAGNLVQQMYGIGGKNFTMKIDTSWSDGVGNTAARVGSSTSGSGPGFNIVLQVDMADFTSANQPDGGSAPFFNDRIIAHEMVHAVMATGQSWGKIAGTNKWFTEGVAEFIHGADDRVVNEIGGYNAILGKLNSADLLQWDSDSPDYSSGYLAVRYMHAAIKDVSGGASGVQDVLLYLDQNDVTLDQALAAASSNAFDNVNDFMAKVTAAASNGVNGVSFGSYIGLNLTNADTGAIGGMDADGATTPKTATSVMPDSGMSAESMSGFALDWGDLLNAKGTGLGISLGFQVGANAGEFVFTNTGDLNLGVMGMEDVDISTSSGATTALRRLDDAIDYVSAMRGRLGAQMNRFESVIATLQISSENTSASRGRIVDADYAHETASLARTQILQQAGTAMVAQANQQPQMVLSLLR